MERTQRTVTDNLLNKLPSDLEFIDPQWLGGFGIPGFLVDRIKFELHKNLGDSIVPPKTEWADMDAKPVRAAWTRFIEAIEAETRLPAASARSVIESAVGDLLNILVEPRKNLPDYLFGNDKTLDFRQACERVETIVVYTHFGQHLPNYMRRKQLDFIDRERFSSFISQLDAKLTAQYSPLNWAQLLAPLFELNNHLIEPELLARFFRDKQREQLALLFDRKEGALSQTQLIEILSAPAIDHDSDTAASAAPAVPAPVVSPAPSAHTTPDPASSTGTDTADGTDATDSADAADGTDTSDDTVATDGTDTADETVVRDGTITTDETVKSQHTSVTSEQDAPVETSPKPVEPHLHTTAESDSGTKKVSDDVPDDTASPPEPARQPRPETPAASMENDSDTGTDPEPEISTARETSARSETEPVPYSVEPAVSGNTDSADQPPAKPTQQAAPATTHEPEKSDNEPAPLWQQFRQPEETGSAPADEPVREVKSVKPARETDRSDVRPEFISKPEPPVKSVAVPEPKAKTEPDEDRPLFERYKNEEADTKEQPAKPPAEEVPDTRESAGKSSDETLPMWKRFISAASSVRIPELGKSSGEEKSLGDSFTHPDDDYELDIEISNPLRIDEIKKTLDDKKKYYIKRFFKDDQAAFNTVIRDLAEMESWDEAGPYITKNIFKKNKIDPYSDEAINFIDRLQSYFTTHTKK